MRRIAPAERPGEAALLAAARVALALLLAAAPWSGAFETAWAAAVVALLVLPAARPAAPKAALDAAGRLRALDTARGSARVVAARLRCVSRGCVDGVLRCADGRRRRARWPARMFAPADFRLLRRAALSAEDADDKRAA